MKKIKQNSYLELEKYPQIITNIKRLINKSIDADYIDEYRKYLLTAVVEGMLNSNNEYQISLDEIRVVSILYTFEKDGIENLIGKLIDAELLIFNSDETYSFNEDIYNQTLVEDEKHKIMQDARYPLIYVKSPWNFTESEENYSIIGYSDILQDDSLIATIGKLDDGCDYMRKRELESLIHLPDYFEILKKSIDYIVDENLKNKVENLLNSIVNFDPECTIITSGEEYDSFLDNKTDDKLEILDVSEWMETFGAYDIVDEFDTIACMYANDIDMEEIYGCMALIMYNIELYDLIIDVAIKLPKDNDLYIKISELVGEDTIKDWVE